MKPEQTRKQRHNQINQDPRGGNPAASLDIEAGEVHHGRYPASSKSNAQPAAAQLACHQAVGAFMRQHIHNSGQGHGPIEK
ncbi:MAG: hypothetical protein M1318_08600 [Firmicutes bacterium]|jgi:hypothetical protein|nr:hypothetical protein [Bacillota bacterium]